MSSQLDHQFMQRALELARLAASADEVPVGAVLVKDDKIIAESHNAPITTTDPTAHAEIQVLRKAALEINNYRLVGATLYVTLEPCMMCAGALVHSRIDRLVFGASDPKSGVISSCAKLLKQPFLNHRIEYEGGVMAEECGQVLSDFFKAKR